MFQEPTTCLRIKPTGENKGNRWKEMASSYTKHLDPVRPETVFQLHESVNSLQATLSWISSFNICICKCTDKNSQDLTFLPLRGPNKILPKFTDDTQSYHHRWQKDVQYFNHHCKHRKQILNKGNLQKQSEILSLCDIHHFRININKQT